MEGELRATKATAVNAEDNEHLEEQVRTLSGDVIDVQSLVESLTAENSRLTRENETAGPAENPLLPEPPQNTMSALVGEEDDAMTKVEQLSKRL